MKEPSAIYQRCVRPILFRLDAERAHEWTVRAGELLGRIGLARRLLSRRYHFEDPRLTSSVAGIRFPNPVGLAAGMDKNGRMIAAASAMGFGFIEIGSISAQPSAGNPRPRLFRLPLDQAIVVNYGVPNEGAQVVAERLRGEQTEVPLGVNIVETNTGVAATPDEVIRQFVDAARAFVGSADYLALNLNCPNTAAGQSVFDRSAHLRDLLGAYLRIEPLPTILLKIPPHTDPSRISQILEVVDPFPFVRGFIFNLPPGKPYELRTPVEELAKMPGAVAGKPTRSLINAAIRAWYQRIDRRRHSIIGVGGIFSAQDAYEKVRLGASLVQLYTALVYCGPGVVRRINEGLCELLDRDGLRHLSEAVGIDVRVE